MRQRLKLIAQTASRAFANSTAFAAVEAEVGAFVQTVGDVSLEFGLDEEIRLTLEDNLEP